ncbi:calcium-transporting ATPase 4, plasma membrane-type-like [Impatiens glandulifera]|uniref:calcium-transporting ATPase 4, plasma membrane-type-like n=1 Tax=Impatiens glandulifera TaxID=253017 RepID=UPI001FB19408|nr:calcium-transporting ATPase 4, plasma membrane-type-like [Impatiens glandulifera]
MDRLLGDFEIPAKDPSDEDLSGWRSSVGLVKNHSRRYRNVADLAVRTQSKQIIRQTQERLRVLLYVQRAALRFIDGASFEEQLSEEAQQQGFRIHPNQLASIIRNHNLKRLESHGGPNGIANKINVSLTHGVDSNDVPKRQNIYGSNTFAQKLSKSFWFFLWEALHDITLNILMVCAVISIIVGLPTEGWPTGIYDGLGILLSILLVVTVTAVSDYRQSLQFQDLDKEKKNIIVHVTRDGYRQKISIFQLVVGDIVHLSIGDQVPADGIFISGYSLLIDESSLSGESEPVDINRERPFLLAGTKVQDGSGKMLVTTVGMRTEWGKLTEALNDGGGEDETPLQVKLNGVATVIGKIGLVFSILTFTVLVTRFLINKGIQKDLTNWSLTDALQLLNYFATAVTIIVVAVPEGLPLAVTLSLAFAMKKLMNEKALVRHLAACETMGSATTICTDKTGTLTTNHMVVDKIWLSGKNFEGDRLLSSLDLSENCLIILLQAIFQNTAAEVVLGKDGNRSVLGTPTESAILEYGLLLGGDFDSQRREIGVLKVEPFNSVKKKMSVLVLLPDGRKRVFCKGASEIILGFCTNMVDINGEVVSISDDVNDVINSFASDALRTLSLAYKDIDDDDLDYENNGIIPDNGYTLIAVVGIKDPVRPGVKEAVQICLAAGITVRMVTGDNINTAKAIARECGILTEDGLAIEGSDFRSKSPEDLKSILPKIQVMARSLPLDKHRLVSSLKNTGEVVAVTGDGTNDAPALHESNIGLAMGIAGTEVAKENADVIILDDNFKTIVNVAKWGRAVYINIQKFVQFQLTVNIVALMLNFVSACVTASAPLTAVQLLWVNLIMDTLGALALATEPPNEGLMKRKPVRKETGFITKIMWRNIFGQSIYQLIVLFVLTFDGLNLLKLGDVSNGTKILNTFIFNTFVFCQVFNEINSRDMEKTNVFSGLFESWVFLTIIVSTAAFQAIIVEFLGAFASTVPLSWQLWLLSILIGAISLPVGILLKCISVNKTAPLLHQNHHDGYAPLPSGPEMA